MLVLFLGIYYTFSINATKQRIYKVTLQAHCEESTKIRLLIDLMHTVECKHRYGASISNTGTHYNNV